MGVKKGNTVSGQESCNVPNVFIIIKTIDIH